MYFGSNDHHLYAASAEGVLKWRFATEEWYTARPR